MNPCAIMLSFLKQLNILDSRTILDTFNFWGEHFPVAALYCALDKQASLFKYQNNFAQFSI